MPVVLPDGNPNLSYKEIVNIIINKIINNWSEINPPVDDPSPFNNIHFNTDWYDDQYEFEVSFLHLASPRDFAALGSKAIDYSIFIELHLFVKQLTEEHPEIAGNIENEIYRIIVSNIDNFGNGISLVIPSEFDFAREEDNTSTVWHSIMTIQVVLMKFIIP